jgi:cytochrome c-type biogenesis protein CcmF
LPLVTVFLVAFNLVVVIQEFVAGVRARRTSADRRGERESYLKALYPLVDRNRRRYGGYIVHVGIVAMFMGFVGTAWTLDGEASLQPGQKFTFGRYELRYTKTFACPGHPACSARQQGDVNKRMIFTELAVVRSGEPVGVVQPAKFIYERAPESPTTEVGLLRGFREDLYVAVGTVNPESGRASFQFHINPFVSWIWIGLLVLIAGSTLSLWPELGGARLGAWRVARATATVASSAGVALWLAASPAAVASTAAGHSPARPADRPTLAGPKLARPGQQGEQPGPSPGAVLAAPLLGLGLGLGRTRNKGPAISERAD